VRRLGHAGWDAAVASAVGRTPRSKRDAVDRLRVSTAQVRQLYGKLADRQSDTMYSCQGMRRSCSGTRFLFRPKPAPLWPTLCSKAWMSKSTTTRPAEEVWREEIYRRLQQIDSGAVRLIPWDDAERRLWARLER